MSKFLKYLLVALLIAVIGVGAIFYWIYQKGETQGSVAWQSCQRLEYRSWFVFGEPPAELQCAVVHVPVNHAKPDGKTFAIALTRLPSKNPNAVGELLLLDGGPGSNSLSMAFFMLDGAYAEQVKDNFHLIGYAPRGVPPSSPAMDCGGLDESSGAKKYVQMCTQKTGADILPFIGSKDVVKDLDYIRAQLDVDTWSMVGYSYGTKLVAKYAEHYPNRLRAGVADGVVDTAEDLFTVLVNQYKGAQFAFERFMEFCQMQGECVFEGDKEPSRAFVDKLHHIETKNLTDKNGEAITAVSLLKIFDENVNHESFWQDMVVMFADLEVGGVEAYQTQKEFSKLNEKGFSNDALVLVNCADSAPKMSKDDYLKHAKLVDAQARYDDITPVSEEEYLDACYYWEYGAGDELAENLVNERTPNLLFISHEHDLATPLGNAQTMSKRFGDTLIVVPQHGHTVGLFGTNACVDEVVVRYLNEPSTDFGEGAMICE